MAASLWRIRPGSFPWIRWNPSRPYSCHKKNICSTKNKKKPTTAKIEGGEEYTIPLKKHNDVYISVDNARETMYTNQISAFPTRSRKGNRYVMILCEIENNFILDKAMKNRTAEEMIWAYQVLMKRIKTAGSKPKSMFLTMKFLRILSRQSCK